MSCAVQQGPNIRLVPPGDVNNQHAYTQTDRQLNHTCIESIDLRERNLN